MNTELGRDLSPAASDGQGRDTNRERSACQKLSRMPRPQRHPAVIHCILSVRSPSPHPEPAALKGLLSLRARGVRPAPDRPPGRTLPFLVGAWGLR